MRVNLFHALNTRTGFTAALLLLTALSAALRGVLITHPPTRVFDEVYSPVFAWKFLRGEPFFDVHPFLTQLPQTVGLVLFGDTPLGWRFSAWMFGSLFIAGIGLFGAALTGQRLVGVLASLLSMLDIAFFVYGRTGLPDMFLLATFVWALAFFSLSARARRLFLALLAALASGVLLGNLAATKWIGLGAIALVWLWIGLSATLGSAALLPRIRWWLYPIVFLLVPALTYLLWTVPVVGIPGSVPAAVGEALFETPCTFGRTPNPAVQGPTSWLARVRHWHCTVWNYHAYLTATHPYGSPWWSWPLLKHPVLFHLDTSVDPPRRISATGNPILWWTGFAAVLLTLLSLPVRYWRALGVSRRGVEPPSGQGSEQQRGERGGESQRGESRWDSPASLPRDTSALHSLFLDLWLVLGILGFWLPWALIQRVAFHYHYFLSFTLTVVLLAVWLSRLLERPAFRLAVFGFLLAAVVGFVYLYPFATATSAFWLR